MEYNVDYDQENDILIARCYGDITIDYVRDYRDEILKKSKEHGCMRLLNDVRNMSTKMGTMELFNWHETLRTEGLDRKWVRAIVSTEQHFEDFRFYENVAVNRGYRVKAFTEFDDAVIWLKE